MKVRVAKKLERYLGTKWGVHPNVDIVRIRDSVIIVDIVDISTIMDMVRVGSIADIVDIVDMVDIVDVVIR